MIYLEKVKKFRTLLLSVEKNCHRQINIMPRICYKITMIIIFFFFLLFIN